MVQLYIKFHGSQYVYSHVDRIISLLHYFKLATFPINVVSVVNPLSDEVIRNKGHVLKSLPAADINEF